MNPHSSITQEQVFESADRLVASGQAPTYKSIREDLKSGSFTTLANHLAEWKKLQSEQVPVPQPPSEFLLRSLQIWNTAYREAKKIFMHEKQAFEMEQEKWKEEKIEFLFIIQKLEQEKSTELAQQNQTQIHITHLNQELRQAQDHLIQLQTQLEGAETRRATTAQRADRLEAQITRLADRAGLPEKGDLQ